jgi:hypothetical protein
MKTIVEILISLMMIAIAIMFWGVVQLQTQVTELQQRPGCQCDPVRIADKINETILAVNANTKDRIGDESYFYNGIAPLSEWEPECSIDEIITNREVE